MFTYFWQRKRETEHEQARGRERGRHRIWNRLQALSCQHRAWGRARTHGPRDHELSQSQTLNLLSHPSAPSRGTWWDSWARKKRRRGKVDKIHYLLTVLFIGPIRLCEYSWRIPEDNTQSTAISWVQSRGSHICWQNLWWIQWDFFFLMFIFWETEHERGRGREQGSHRFQSRLQALICQHRAWGRARTHEPWDHDLNWSQRFNRISLPGAQPSNS